MRKFIGERNLYITKVSQTASGVQNLENGQKKRLDSHQVINNLTLFYQNVRGLRTKLRDIYVSSAALEYDVFLLETWLAPEIIDSEIFCNQFNVY